MSTKYTTLGFGLVISSVYKRERERDRNLVHGSRVKIKRSSVFIIDRVSYKYKKNRGFTRRRTKRE